MSNQGLTAKDVYDAWLQAYAEYAATYAQAGIPVPRVQLWENMSFVDRQVYVSMAEILNKRNL